MTVFTEIESARLRLRHFQDSDLTLFMGYRNDPIVAKYQSWEGINELEASTFIQEQKEIQPGVPGQGFQVAIELKATGILIGDGYFTINTLDHRQAEIGFTLSREYQGCGYATEAVSCFLNYGFHTFDLHRIIAITDCENIASVARSEEHTSELQSRLHLVCRLLLEKKNNNPVTIFEEHIRHRTRGPWTTKG